MQIHRYDQHLGHYLVDGEVQFFAHAQVTYPPGIYTLGKPLYSMDTGCIAIKATGPEGDTFLIHDAKKASSGVCIPELAFLGLATRLRALRGQVTLVVEGPPAYPGKGYGEWD